MKIIEENDKLTQLQISDTLEVPIRTVQRAIKELSDKKYIQWKGSKKSGQYLVLQPLLAADSEKEFLQIHTLQEELDDDGTTTAISYIS